MTMKKKLLITIGTTFLALPIIYVGIKKERELENLRKEIDMIPWEVDEKEKKSWLTKWTMIGA